METIPCPCGTSLLYETCCKPYHDGHKPPNALALMRSRYTAYALAINPSYIIETTHPQGPQYQKNQAAWKKEILLFSRETQFEKLEILTVQEKGDKALITFHAHLKRKGKEASIIECSLFKKEGNKWLYFEGTAVR